MHSSHRLAALWSLFLGLLPVTLLAQGALGPEVFVAAPPTIDNGNVQQLSPRVAADDAGNVYVFWERRRQVILSDPDHGIYRRFFDAGDRSGGGQAVADHPDLDETGPSVAQGPGGRVVLAYSVDDLSNIPACTTPSLGKVHQVLYVDGAPSGGGQVNANGGGGRAGVAGASRAVPYVVAYEGNDCPGLGIVAGTKLRRFGGSPPNPVQELPGLFSALPLSVDINEDGVVALVVADDSSGFCDTASPCPLVVHRFDAVGNPLLPVAFAPYANTGPVTQFAPAVAVLPGGGFVVVWVRLDFNVDQTLFVVGRRYNAAGNPVGPELEVSQGVVPDFSQSFLPPSLSLNAAGEMLVAFGIEGMGYVRSYRADGQPTGPPVRVTSRRLEAISATLTDGGRGAVSYLEEGSGNIYYRRLLGSGCQPSPTALCLNNGRFRVSAEWQTAQGATGEGQAVPLTSDTGYFWFFDSANVELVVKALDACAPPFDRFWIFAAGLTDVEVTLTVEDTARRKLKTYVNPLGAPFAPILDTDAFATCP